MFYTRVGLTNNVISVQESTFLCITLFFFITTAGVLSVTVLLRSGVSFQ